MKARQIRLRAKTQYVSVDGMTFLRASAAKRCRTYVAGCANCESWRFLDEKGRFAYTHDELEDFMNQGESNEDK